MLLMLKLSNIQTAFVIVLDEICKTKSAEIVKGVIISSVERAWAKQINVKGRLYISIIS